MNHRNCRTSFRRWLTRFFCLRTLLIFIVTIPCVESGYANKNKLILLTLNIRYDNENDGINRWESRKERIFRFLRNNKADVVCLQEVLHNQLLDLTSTLNEYSYVGFGRVDGHTMGEYTPILFLKKKYEKVDSGVFWLSECPDSIGSVGWDASLPRIATWVKLKLINSNKMVVVVNTHLDHIGKKAKLRSSLLIKNWIKVHASNNPVILTGDMNSFANSDVYCSFLEKGITMNDVYKVASHRKGVDFTFHDFGRLEVENRRMIDFVFVSKEFRPVSVNIPFVDKGDNIFLSDHNPILAILRMK